MRRYYFDQNNDRRTSFTGCYTDNQQQPDISNDTNGLMIQSALTQGGHQVVDYQIVRDDREEILKHLHEWVCSVDVVITSGGTGLAKRDVTLETVEPLFDKPIPGFAGLMTAMAYRNDYGVQSLAYRSSAGVCRQCLIFCLPGLPRLIKVGMEKIILPEVSICTSNCKSNGHNMKKSDVTINRPPCISYI